MKNLIYTIILSFITFTLSAKDNISYLEIAADDKLSFSDNDKDLIPSTTADRILVYDMVQSENMISETMHRLFLSENEKVHDHYFAYKIQLNYDGNEFISSSNKGQIEVIDITLLPADISKQLESEKYKKWSFDKKVEKILLPDGSYDYKIHGIENNKHHALILHRF